MNTYDKIRNFKTQRRSQETTPNKGETKYNELTLKGSLVTQPKPEPARRDATYRDPNFKH